MTWCAEQSIRTEHLVVRCWALSDAPLLAEAIGASLGHLRSWLPWAVHEPEPVEVKRERIERYRVDFANGGEYRVGALDIEQTRVVGAGGLHTGEMSDSREIGYWIRADSLKRGYATEMVGALTRVGFELAGLERLEIRCDPENRASAALPRCLGFRHVETLPQETLRPDGAPRDTMIWELTRTGYPDSPAAMTELEVRDAAGRRVL